jgi:outer membrane protein TolC
MFSEMESLFMRHINQRLVRAFLAAVVMGDAGAVAAQIPAGASQPAAGVRRLTVDEAVRFALEQNLGIQVDRLNPQIQDLTVAQAKTAWVPNLSTTFSNTSQDSPPRTFLSGGAGTIKDTNFATQVGISQVLKNGTNYSLTWNSARATSTNAFNNFDPLLSSRMEFSLTQPLLRNYKIDNTRQLVETSQKDREAADIQLQSTILATTRNVKNAYWDLAYQIENLNAQQQSLDLAKRLLADNEKRVQIGTMAPIDIVEAQAEVARNEESVIVAQAGIKQAEDRLRALIFNPSMPDFWTISIEPTESMPFVMQRVEVEDAIQRALANRTDVQTSKNALARQEIGIRYYRNQALPDVSAQAVYRNDAIGGTLLSPINLTQIGAARTVVDERRFNTVLGDVLTNAYPTWTFGLTVAYPIGKSAAEANLARAKLQYSQAETQLKDLQLAIATQVRDVARQVQTNQKRVESARAARALAERRLDAEEKKFAAGIQTTFFVFQAQRDLAQARTNEVRAMADYNKSLVDFESIQQTGLR